MQDGGQEVGDIGDRIWKKAVYIIFSFYLIKCNDLSIFSRKNEITIPRLPPKATEPTYELNGCENKFS